MSRESARLFSSGRGSHRTVTVTSDRSNLRGALHSTFLRDSYYWDGTIVRAKPAILRASVGSTEAACGESNGIDSGPFDEACADPVRNRGRSGAASRRTLASAGRISGTETHRFTGPWDRAAGSGCGAPPPRHPPRGGRRGGPGDIANSPGGLDNLARSLSPKLSLTSFISNVL